LIAPPDEGLLAVVNKYCFANSTVYVAAIDGVVTLNGAPGIYLVPPLSGSETPVTV
jgi:hypothetical protein